MTIEDKDFEVTIAVSVRRQEEISTGKVVTDSRTYTITDRYTESQLKVLISELTPEVIPPI